MHALAANELGAVVARLRRLLVQEFVQRCILRLLLNSWMLDGVVCDDKQGIQVVGDYFGLIIVVCLLQEEVVLKDVNREEEVLVLLAQQVGLPDHVICTHALRVFKGLGCQFVPTCVCEVSLGHLHEGLLPH